MSQSNEGEGKLIAGNFDSSAAPPAKPLTESEQARQQKVMQKRAHDELNDYKKRLRASNELKQMQVDELRLGVEYYNYKVEFRALKPKMDELEAIEEAESKEEKERQRKDYEEYLAQQKKLEEEKPKIIIPKVGKPREK